MVVETSDFIPIYMRVFFSCSLKTKYPTANNISLRAS